jgi:hypothetical protein
MAGVEIALYTLTLIGPDKGPDESEGYEVGNGAVFGASLFSSYYIYTPGRAVCQVL